jgi:hypothetical protein
MTPKRRFQGRPTPYTDPTGNHANTRPVNDTLHRSTSILRPSQQVNHATSISPPFVKVSDTGPTSRAELPKPPARRSSSPSSSHADVESPHQTASTATMSGVFDCTRFTRLCGSRSGGSIARHDCFPAIPSNVERPAPLVVASRSHRANAPSGSGASERSVHIPLLLGIREGLRLALRR